MLTDLEVKQYSRSGGFLTVPPEDGSRSSFRNSLFLLWNTRHRQGLETKYFSEIKTGVHTILYGGA